MFETGLCGINSHRLGLVFKGLTGGDTQELETKRNGMVKKKQPTWCTLRLQTASVFRFRFRFALVQGPCVRVCVCVRARACESACGGSKYKRYCLGSVGSIPERLLRRGS